MGAANIQNSVVVDFTRTHTGSRVGAILYINSVSTISVVKGDIDDVVVHFY